jgi:hypothetical protein
MAVQPSESRQSQLNGGANTKSLLKLNIARSCVDIQQHAAISYLALNMVLSQCALSCYLVIIEPQRS